jgi:hypothetical protein
VEWKNVALVYVLPSFGFVTVILAIWGSRKDEIDSNKVYPVDMVDRGQDYKF